MDKDEKTMLWFAVSIIVAVLALGALHYYFPGGFDFSLIP